MPTLADFRHLPGSRLKTEFATPLMVLQLCAGMCKGSCSPSGGHDSVAVVNLQNGRTSFESEDLEVVAVEIVK